MQAIQDTTQKKKKRRPKNNRRAWIRRLSPLVTLGLILALWQLVVSLEIYQTFIIPPPAAVAEKFVDVLQDGSLLEHTSVTLYEVLFGLLIGVGIASVLGYVIAKVPLLEDALSPVIVAFQSTPVVAYAPLLILWFGSGVTSKIVTCAVIVFFPTLMNTIVGIRSVPNSLHDLMRSLNATRWQTFYKLEIPAALPILLAGLKMSATLGVIGAVVGEFVSAGQGLGSLATIARSQYDTPLVFVAVITMTALALTLYSAVSLLEARLLAWRRRSH